MNCIDISDRGKIAHDILKRVATANRQQIEKTTEATKKVVQKFAKYVCTISSGMNQWTVAVGTAINSDSF